MSVPTEGTTFQRLGEIANALVGPVVAFQLGRYSEVFSGRALAWVAVVCYAVALSLILYSQVRTSRKEI
jgi:hypothetical protein